MPSNKVRTRFAPSPTGYMHVGNLRTALYTYLMAKHEDGTFILRIEDTDQGRYVEGAVDVIYNTLRETGLLWDEGPDIGGPVGPYVQSERMGMFKQYAEQLVAEGKAYYCFCTEERLEALHAEQRANGEMTHYDGCCRDLPEEEVKQRLAAGEPYVIRQKIPKEGVTGFDDVVYGHIEVENSEMDDQILIKTDGMPTYNFANVVDDHLMGITHVIRGSEYLSSTPKYNLLYLPAGLEPQGRVRRAGDLQPGRAHQDLEPGRHLQVPRHLRPPQAAGHQRGVYPPPEPRGVPEEGRALDRSGRAHPHRQEAALCQPAAPL